MFKLNFLLSLIIITLILLSNGEKEGNTESSIRYEVDEDNGLDNYGRDEIKSSIVIRTIEELSSVENGGKNLPIKNKLKDHKLPSYVKLLEEYPSKIIIHHIKKNNKKTKIYNLCGGVLITNQRILTSSACFYHDTDLLALDSDINEYVKNYKVSLFADTLTFNWKKKFLHVKKINIKSFSDNGDIAILELEREIVRTRVTNHAFLPEFKITMNKNLSVLQHTKKSVENISIDKVKKGIINVSNLNSLHISNDSDFHTLFFGYYVGDESGLCYMLPGDPVYNETDTVVGILQVVHDCKDKTFPFVFTDIFKHKEWIVNGLITGFY